MAFGRTADAQKEAERNGRDRQRADDRAGRDRQKADEKVAKERDVAEEAFLGSPVGRAMAAGADGAGFFHVELEMSEVGRPNLDLLVGYSGAHGVERWRAGHTDVLAQIENVGWRLEHVGYVCGETGQTVGHFLFRRAETSGAATPDA